MFIAEIERGRDDFSQPGGEYRGFRPYGVGERQGPVFNHNPPRIHVRKVARAEGAPLRITVSVKPPSERPFRLRSNGSPIAVAVHR